MDNPILLLGSIILLLIAAFISAMALFVVVSKMTWLIHLVAFNVMMALTKLQETFEDSLDELRMQYDSRIGQRTIERELFDDEMRKATGRVDRSVIEAARYTERITRCASHLKEASRSCSNIHLFTAKIAGAEHMHDIAHDEICIQFRQRVVDTMSVSINCIAEYPNLISNDKLLMQLKGIEQMREACMDCMMLKFRVQDAPPMCEPARVMGNKPDGENDAD